MYKPYEIPVSAKGVVFENGKVWLRKNERNEWELPGGKIDEGEQPKDAVQREMREELGFEVVVKDIVQAYLYEINKSLDESRGVLVVSYLCEVRSKPGDFEHVGETGTASFEAFPIGTVAGLKMPAFYKEAILRAVDLS